MARAGEPGLDKGRFWNNESFNPASQVVGSPSLGLDREMARISEEMRQNNGTVRSTLGDAFGFYDTILMLDV